MAGIVIRIADEQDGVSRLVRSKKRESFMQSVPQRHALSQRRSAFGISSLTSMVWRTGSPRSSAQPVRPASPPGPIHGFTFVAAALSAGGSARQRTPLLRVPRNSLPEETAGDETIGLPGDTGVVNFINFTFSALLGPVFGWLLVAVTGDAAQRELAHYQATFQPLLYGVILALVLTLLLKETGTAAARGARVAESA